MTYLLLFIYLRQHKISAIHIPTFRRLRVTEDQPHLKWRLIL